MPYRKRPRVELTEEWSQLQLQLAWPEQVSYDLIRPVVLSGLSPAERAKQTGVSPRTCGRILALNRKLYGLPGPSKQPHEPQAMPFKAGRRHQYWTVDLRYLDHQLGDGKLGRPGTPEDLVHVDRGGAPHRRKVQPVGGQPPGAREASFRTVK